MYTACIALVDATRARLFQLNRTAEADGLHDELIEVSDLVNPVRHLRPSEMFSDSGLGSSGQHGFAYDDHRDAHIDHIDADFARSIADEVGRLAVGADRLVICASPRMLGHLRGVLAKFHNRVDEIPKDLVKMTPSQIREQLASYGFLPPAPPRPSSERRAW